MIDELKDIPVFMMAVEAGNFSAAAERLHLTRSAVGKTIARLEGRLETRLFHRTTRNQTLTDAGQVFYEHCQQAMAVFRNGKSTLDAGRNRVDGVLCVSMPALFGRQCIAPILTRLASEYPNLDVRLNFNDRVVDLFDDGVDLAIRNFIPDQASGLMQRRIASQRMTICAAPGYIEKHGLPESVSDLSDHEAIFYAKWGNRPKPWQFTDMGKSCHYPPPQTRFVFDDLGAIADAAVAGLGIACLPCWLVREHFLSGALVWLLKDVPTHTFSTYAVWPETPYLPMRVRIAIDALASDLPKQVAAWDNK